MKIKIPGIISLMVVLLLSGCSAEAPEEASQKPIPTPSATIKLEVTSSWWRREGPYDIYTAIKWKLENVGFKVASKESTVYDCVLFVDYKESKDGLYTGGVYGTDIKCHLKLDDKVNNIFFEKEISSYSPFHITYLEGTNPEELLYNTALGRFQNNLYFRSLGPILASKYIFGDEESFLIFQLRQDDNLMTRGYAAQALGEIGTIKAVEPLIAALKDESALVRNDAAEALGKLGDKRAVEPLTAALEDKDAGVRASAQEALEKINARKQ